MSTPTPTLPAGWTPTTDASGNPSLTAPDGKVAEGDVFTAVSQGFADHDALMAAQTQITQLTAEVQTLTDEVNTLKGTPPPPVDDDTKEDDAIAADEKNITTDEASITTLQTSVTSLSDQVTQAQSDLTALTTRVTALEALVKGIPAETLAELVKDVDGDIAPPPPPTTTPTPAPTDPSATGSTPAVDGSVAPTA